MSYKEMWKTACMKARYGFMSYVFYSAISVMFIVFYFFLLLTTDSSEAHDLNTIQLMAFLYVPMNINLMFQSIEYSKCWYLVPRTGQERKRFIVFENVVKMISSSIVLTIMLAISILVRPESAREFVNTYLFAGISFTVIMGTNGYCMYKKRKKKQTYKQYLIKYTISVVVVTALILGMYFLLNNQESFLGRNAAYIMTAGSCLYHLYAVLKFHKASAIYENIDRNEQKFMSRMGSRML